MRFIGIGLAATFALAAMFPVAAMAAPKEKPAAAPKLDPKALEKGMAEAPARIAAAKLACTPTAARWVGEDKKTNADAIEVACSGGMGYLLETTKAADGAMSVKMFPCLGLNEPVNGKPNPAACQLPGNNSNETQIAALNPFVAKGGRSCVLDKARVIGQSATNVVWEVGCQGGAGFILITSAPPSVDNPVELNTCMAYAPGTQLECKLTTRETEMAVVDTLNTQAAKNCAIKDKRYVLATKTGLRYFEVACADGKGYMFEQAANGSLARAIDCAAASFVDGGCTLTDAVAAQSEQASLYTSLVKKAGYNCDVELYAVFAIPTDRKAQVDEIIELKCTNRPDGGIAIFGKAGGPPAIYNCAASEAIGFRCSKTKPVDALAQINKDIAAAADKPFACNAYATGGLAMTTEDILVEVGCDPEGRFAVAYSRTTGKPTGTRSCLSMGDKCKLPTVRKVG